MASPITVWASGDRRRELHHDWVTSENGGSSIGPSTMFSSVSAWNSSARTQEVSPFADPSEVVGSLLDSRMTSQGASHHQESGAVARDGRHTMRSLEPAFSPFADSEKTQPSDIRRDALGFGEVEGRSSSDSSSMRSRMSVIPQEPVWAFSAAASVDNASSRASRSEPRGSPAVSTRSISTVGSATLGAMVSLGQMPGAEIPEDLSVPPVESSGPLRVLAFDQSRLSRISSLSSSARLTGLWSQDGGGTSRPSMGLVSPLSSTTFTRPLVINTGLSEPVAMPPVSPPGDRRSAIATANLSVWDPESPMFMSADRWEPPKAGFYGPKSYSNMRTKSEPEQGRIQDVDKNSIYPYAKYAATAARIERPDSVLWSAPPPPQPAPLPKDPEYIPRSSARRHSMTDMNLLNPVPVEPSRSIQLGYSALPTGPSDDISPQEYSYVYTPETTGVNQGRKPHSMPSAKGQLVWDDSENQWVISRSRSLDVGRRSASTPACPARQAIGAAASRLLRSSSSYRVSTT